MKIAIATILMINSVFLFGQELETDTSWIESESKSLFTEADELTSIVYYHLELDYLIENLDTLTEKGKIKKEVYLEQKEDLLERALRNYEQLTSEYPTSSLYYKALNNREIIEFEFEMYDEAKKYLEESTKHKHHHWCGNAHEEKEFWLAYQRSKIESKLGNYEKARKLMIPHLFSRRIMKDQELAQYCLDLLLQAKTKEELIKEFEKGLSKYYTKKRRPDSKYLDYFISFLGEEIEVDIYTPDNKDEELKMIHEKVENQWIYYLIKSEK
jgi:tetratricopeptide (TPR) repeat protein